MFPTPPNQAKQLKAVFSTIGSSAPSPDSERFIRGIEHTPAACMFDEWQQLV